MGVVANLMHGLAVATTPANLLYTMLGTLTGTICGLLPGIGPASAMAMLIPLTFGMQPTQAFVLLAGIYYGGQYGGAITSILLNTPGDASAVMTVRDGYPMAQKGRAGAALAISAVSAFVAGTLGVITLTFIAVPIASFALRFGPPETFALLFFALTTVSALTGSSVAKGVFSTFFGLAISTVGLDPQTGTPRFTLGSEQLLNGISFLDVVVGVFALAEVARMIEKNLSGGNQAIRIKGRLWFTREEGLRALPAMLRGWAVGFFCGSAPGLGGTIAAMLAYVLEKRISKRPDEFGKGAVEGIAAPEAAGNADAAGAFVHLLALGIPGSGSTAVIMGAFIMFGLQPGPLLFQTQPEVVWGLIASMYIGNVMLLILNLPLVGVFVQILRIPQRLLVVFIMVTASIGVYSFNTSTFDLYLALGFGVIGYLFDRLGVPKAPMIFGVILGGRLETALRQSITISSGDLTIFLKSPIAATLLACAALSLMASIWLKKSKTQ